MTRIAQVYSYTYIHTPYTVYVHLYIAILVSFYLVLVAHNGFNFDFPFLMEEIRRCNLKESFEKVDLWFADTWYDANRVSSWLANIYMYLYTYSHVCYSLVLNLWPLL